MAEVDGALLEDATGWSPYLFLDDAYKLDDVREAWRRGDITAASRSSRVFSLTQVSRSVMDFTMIALAGFDGGGIAGLADRKITVRPGMYEQVEDAHGIILHMIVSTLGRP
jgi:hypothetical protein